MHELPIVEDIINVMDQEAEKNQIQKITEIKLVIGELASVVSECVQMYFDIASKGHACENAKLVFEHRQAVLRCSNCGYEFPHQRSFICPECGGESNLIRSTGTDFYIESYEAER